MDSNQEIKWIAAAELLDNDYKLLDNDYNFVIPSYQRGYRWCKQQVEDLLDDLWAFAQSPGESDRYSLHSLEVIPRKNDREVEVVDGQQRLTTMRILFGYLNEVYKDIKHFTLYKMTYERRPNNGGDGDFGGAPDDAVKKWLNGETQERPDMDALHVYNARRTIEEWFNKQEHRDEAGLKNFKNLLFHGTQEKPHVAFLWYQHNAQEEKDSITLFSNLNSGKVPLIASELVKALFLRKPATNAKVGEDRLVMALQWEQIENTLSAPDFWSFLSKKDCAVEQRFNLILQLALTIRTSEQKNATLVEEKDIYRTYEKLLREDGSVEKEWQNILDVFRQLEDWFSDPEVYNWIGFLVHTQELGPTKNTLHELYCKRKVSNGRKDFLDKLYELVRKRLPQDIEKLRYQSRAQVRAVLLFFNVILINQTLKGQDAYGRSSSNKFPFNLYAAQKNGWHLEHIDSQTKDDTELFKCTLHYHVGKIKDLDRDTSESLEKSWQDKNMEWVEKFRNWRGEEGNGGLPGWLNKEQENALLDALSKGEEDREEACKEARGKPPLKDLLGERTEDKDLIDSIQNLALLTPEINCGYGNIPFVLKREDILRKIRQGHFVPIGTQLVFTKAFTSFPDNLLTWKLGKGGDGEAYFNYISEHINNFLNPSHE